MKNSSEADIAKALQDTKNIKRRSDCTYLDGVKSLKKLKSLEKSILFKLPNGYTYFHPKIMIEDPESTNSYNICFKNSMILQISISKMVKGKWMKLDEKSVTVPEIVELING